MSAAMVILELAAAEGEDVDDDTAALLLPCTVLQPAEGVTKPEAGATDAMETAPATASRLLTLPTTTMVSRLLLSFGPLQIRPDSIRPVGSF